MLQGKQAVIRENGSVRMAKNGKNAALVGRFVVLHSEEENGDSTGPLGWVKRRGAPNHEK
jgi:hypothetical protein